MLTLLHYPLCPASRAIRLALHEHDIEFSLSEIKPWDLSREFLNMQPAGTLPVLLVDGKAVSGTYAVIEYLSDTSEPNPIKDRHALWPGTAMEKAEARRAADWFMHKFESEVSHYLLEEKVYKPLSGVRSSPDLPAIRAARGNLRYHLSYVSFLSEQRKWLGGDHLSFADFAAAGHISAMDYLSEMTWPDFPEAKAWYARIKSRPAFRSLLADRIPGFTPPAHYADLDF